MKSWLDNTYEMPDKTVALLIRLLEQNDGKLSFRVRTNEFNKLSDDEVKQIVEKYHNIFNEAN